MIKDIVTELVRGRIVFSCPHCLVGDVFSPETVAGAKGHITALKCPRCSYMVSLNRAKIEAAVAKIVADDPLVKNPFDGMKTEHPAAPGPEPPRPTAQAGPAPAPTGQGTPARPQAARRVWADEADEKLPADYAIQRVHGERGTPMPSAVGLTDLILVVDKEDSFRDDIWITFSDIARVEGYRGASGAGQYIKKRADEITIMMMDLDLGDGSCFSVLDVLRDDDRVNAIPTIVTYIDKSQYDIIKKGLASYPQVKFFIQKEEFIKKMIELSIKIVKHET
jgi:hypothetical protein